MIISAHIVYYHNLFIQKVKVNGLPFYLHVFRTQFQNSPVNIVNTLYAFDFFVVYCLFGNSPRAITLCINNKLPGASPLLAREGTER